MFETDRRADRARTRAALGRHIHWLMKFRLVWLGSDDDPDGNPPAREGDPLSLPISASGRPSYEHLGTEMVRLEQLPNGRW